MPDIPLPSNIPVPDPTLLTTAALDREIAHLRELVTAEHQADVGSLRAAEKAHQLTHEAEERLRDVQHEALLQQVSSLKELLKEALASRDQALAAALASSKEATSKAEAATTKQVDAMGQRFDVEIKGLKDQLGDVKTNQGVAGGRTAGKEYVWGVAILIVALVLSFIGIIFTR
jgi:hypothetical protein